MDVAERAVKGTGLEVAAGGSIGSELSKPETESSELVGIVAAMIILSFAFGTIVAMGMPIITAVVGLVVGLSAIGLMGHLVGVPDIAPTLATMIGLGVGIDYSLFLVNRHRRQIADGMEMQRVDRDDRRDVRGRGGLRRRDRRDRPRGARGGRDPARHLPRLRLGRGRPHRGARGDHPAAGDARPGGAAHRLGAPARVDAAQARRSPARASGPSGATPSPATR